SVTFNNNQRLIVLVSEPLHNLRQIMDRHMRLTRRHLLIINHIEHSNVREVAVLQTLSHVNTHHIVRFNEHTPMLILTYERFTPHVNDDISVIGGSNRRSNTANRPRITGLRYNFLEHVRDKIRLERDATRLSERLFRVRRILLEEQPFTAPIAALLQIIPVFVT